MIRPLRRRHARAMAGLAVVLPLGFAAALVAREPERTTLLPEAVAPAGPAIEAPMHAVDDAWGELDLGMRVGRTAGRVVVELAPRREVRRPDLLVYWTAAESVGDALPGDAYLLGSLGERARRYALPARADGGSLVLYGMAHHGVVASAPLPR